MAGDYDVIVVGGGIAGASLAGSLGDGLRVLLLEAEDLLGYHTSGRSAAFFAETYGGPAVQPLTTASRPMFEGPPEAFGSQPLLTERGALYVGTASQVGSVQAMYRSFPAVQLRLVRPDDVANIAPMLRPEWRATAIWEPDCKDIDTAALHQGYLRQLRANGGTVLTGMRVTALDRVGAFWQVRCGDQVFRTGTVVNAAGAWADELAVMAGVPAIGLLPMRRTMAVVRVPAEEYRADTPLILDIDGSFYFKPDSGTIWVSPHDETPSPPCDAQPELIDVAIALDRLEKATNYTIGRPERSWAGLRTFAPDRAPVFGFDPLAPGFFWCAGQGGFGMQTAPAAGLLCASLILGQLLPDSLAETGVDPSAYSPARFRC